MDVFVSGENNEHNYDIRVIFDVDVYRLLLLSSFNNVHCFQAALLV